MNLNNIISRITRKKDNPGFKSTIQDWKQHSKAESITQKMLVKSTSQNSSWLSLNSNNYRRIWPKRINYSIHRLTFVSPEQFSINFPTHFTAIASSFCERKTFLVSFSRSKTQKFLLNFSIKKAVKPLDESRDGGMKKTNLYGRRQSREPGMCIESGWQSQWTIPSTHPLA